MKHSSETLKKFGICPPDMLIPNPKIDLNAWAVVACDQYTSQPEYWQKVAEIAGDKPSTLHLIYPEVFLEEESPETRIESINSTMRKYLSEGVFDEYPETFFLVHRSTAQGSQRWGLVAALDLEHYSYAKDSRTWVRATEGTIEARIPPRKLIRKDAPLELPHILVLLSDESRSIIEPFTRKTDQLKKVYDTDLMLGGGHITGYAISSEEDLERIAGAFEHLLGKVDSGNPLIYAMGDGNHSLATAKSCWEDLKKTLSAEQQKEHPARYALVELENIFDEGLTFEPIHRVLFNTDENMFVNILSRYCDSYTQERFADVSTLMEAIDGSTEGQTFGYADVSGLSLFTLQGAHASLAAGTLQLLIDDITEEGTVGVDYIHGEDVTEELGRKEGNIGLFLPAIEKSTFFDSIIQDGALPRKTFSMGEADEKRYYMEARRISLS